MKTYARIVNGTAVDVTKADDIKTIFHIELADTFVVVPDDTENGDIYVNGTWSKPVPPTPPAPVPPTVTPPQFKILILPWLTKIRKAAATDEEVAVFVEIIDDPRLTEVDLSLVTVQTGLKYAMSVIGLTADEIAAAMAKVLSGVLT